MKTKLFLAVLCTCLSYTISFAQLSTGESSASVIRTGNRPEGGDFGIFIGPSYSEIKDMCDNKVEFRGFPLVNFKYYSSQNLEWRLGLQFYRTKEKIKGDALNEAFEDMGEIKSKDVKSYNRISPGVAYHFSSRNLLDIYVGGSLPFGWDKDGKINESEYDGEKETNNVTRNTFVIGIGGFIGLQAFVADLPFSIGLEYGFSGLLHSGNKYKHEITTEDGTQTYFTKDKDSDIMFDKLKSKKGEFGSDVRITLSYYFKRK